MMRQADRRRRRAAAGGARAAGAGRAAAARPAARRPPGGPCGGAGGGVGRGLDGRARRRRRRACGARPGALLDRVLGLTAPAAIDPERPLGVVPGHGGTLTAAVYRHPVLTVVPTPLGNLRDITLRALDALARRERDRVRGHAPHARAPERARDPGARARGLRRAARGARRRAPRRARAGGRAGGARLRLGHAADRRSGPPAGGARARRGLRGHGAARAERGRDRARGLGPGGRGLRVPRLGAAGGGRACALPRGGARGARSRA